MGQPADLGHERKRPFQSREGEEIFDICIRAVVSFGRRLNRSYLSCSLREQQGDIRRDTIYHLKHEKNEME